MIVFFFGCEKEPKSVEGCDSLHTSQNAPWRSTSKGSLAVRKKKRFVDFWRKSFSFSPLTRDIWLFLCHVEHMLQRADHWRDISLKPLCCLCNLANKNCLSTRMLKQFKRPELYHSSLLFLISKQNFVLFGGRRIESIIFICCCKVTFISLNRSSIWGFLFEHLSRFRLLCTFRCR